MNRLLFTLLCCFAMVNANCFKAGDYHGADLSGGPRRGVTSPEKCQKYCQETKGCNYFTWHNTKSVLKNNCYLKSAPGTKGLYTGYANIVTSGPLNCDGDCFKAGDYHGADLRGGTRYGVTSREKCQKICQETTGCNYFAWHNTKSVLKHNCYLKSAPGTKGLYTGYAYMVTSGPRNCDGCDCGLANKHTEIFGGVEAKPHEYPWNVYVSVGCGGSLISKQHVLTAAHCVDKGRRKEDIRLQLGAHNKNQPEITARVSKIDIHPDWTGLLSQAPDAAILTLTQPIEFSDKIRPVCLPSDPSVTFQNKVVKATGWGYTKPGQFPDNLMKVEVKVIPIQTCRWSSVRSFLHICTTGVGASNFGTRAGDSGSPLNNPEVGGRYSIIGINSFNSNPDVFTKITPKVKNWIKSLVPGAQTADPSRGCTK